MSYHLTGWFPSQSERIQINMSSVNQIQPDVNLRPSSGQDPQFAVSSRNFDGFCRAVRNAFPAWGRNVQIMWKPTVTGPVATIRSLNGFTLTAGDVASIAALAVAFAPVATELPAPEPVATPVIVVNWPARKVRRPSLKLGRGSSWAGVR